MFINWQAYIIPYFMVPRSVCNCVIVFVLLCVFICLFSSIIIPVCAYVYQIASIRHT